MRSSLIALLSLPLLASACASSDTVDELSGETSADDALEGKGDSGAPDGAYTYFEVWHDPSGWFGLHRLNRSTTVCHDGTSDWGCWVPSLDFAEASLPAELQAKLVEAADRDYYASGALAIVRGRFGSKQYPSYGDLGRFIVTEAWVSDGDDVSDGVFVKAKDNGVRCIQAPCPTVTEKALNTSRSANIAGIDWSYSGYSDEQIAAFGLDMTRPGGVILAGNRYNFTENNVSASGRTATAVYRQLVEPQCHVGGCSGQICSDQEGIVSTCEWREEYACYQTATCERQTDGTCGWTQTPELNACLGQF